MSLGSLVEAIADGAVRYWPVVAGLVGACWHLGGRIRRAERTFSQKLDANGLILLSHGEKLDVLTVKVDTVHDYTVRHAAEYEAGISRLHRLENQLDALGGES